MSDHDREAGWAAAFGSNPGEHPLRVGVGGRAAWLASVTLGGQGRYAAAAALVWPVINGTDPVLAALAAATLAAHRRQLGGHAAARELDALGLRRLAAAGLVAGKRSPQDQRAARAADGTDAAAARSDVLLGLAADAIGLGRLGEARALIGIESASGDGGWRAEIKRGWVAAEVELAAGHPAAAEAPARAAAAAARRSPSVRLLAKSRLVLGVVLAGTGDRAGAVAEITTCLRESITHGMIPLRWPSRIVLADLEPERASEHRSAAGNDLDCVLRHADPVGRALATASPWVPTSGFDLGPNR
ncbi:hypothetical protein [Actinokineospora globicatena]|uniref:hypothetical protein n=1 Tax=Actinokineospora globicatena TaxID=103729 RepID=UPI0020A46D4B|nr:hypothetical protein [Actinokineospora globicatena]MCP2301912.1 hypothetical protein [Actinokineospora globicatena]GLW76429.1 hypothetical protein Aglo01_09110 [Actinokineospora globicatena]GLW83264.1 hypothetical protein Aglo02_09040 [Actinokineospora globicatena]